MHCVTHASPCDRCINHKEGKRANVRTFQTGSARYGKFLAAVARLAYICIVTSVWNSVLA